MTDEFTGNDGNSQDNFMEGETGQMHGIKGIAEEATLGARGTDPVVPEPGPSGVNRAANAVVRYRADSIKYNKQDEKRRKEERYTIPASERIGGSPEARMGGAIWNGMEATVAGAAKVIAKVTQGGLRKEPQK